MRYRALAAAGLLALGACGTGGAGGDVPGDTGDARPFAEISASETVQFVGTEPFWGGKVTGEILSYSTPSDPDGTTITVTRFAGRGGISWTGTFEGQRFALAVTPAECSDGMSDRTFPFVATLAVQGEQRSGCAWTEKQPFSESEPAP